jgi:hypothetical protein
MAGFSTYHMTDEDPRALVSIVAPSPSLKFQLPIYLEKSAFSTYFALFFRVLLAIQAADWIAIISVLFIELLSRDEGTLPLLSCFTLVLC